tara:strand:+ start:317 stop:1057 length:741 start_codon:yes stop_codon:yes gene_type:complete
MQGYFSYFPDLNYVSRTTDRSSNDELIAVKNIFRRPKLRDDLKNVVTAFEDYVITGDDRPDQVSERVYGDPRFDWVILITNNITKVRDQWPLNSNDFQNYILAKYGSEENLTKVHHYVTELMIDSNQRMVVPDGLTVDSNFDSRYLETSGEFTYSGTNLPELRSVDNSGTVKDFTGRTVTHNNVFAVSNYEFEENENDAKRRIKILQPQYLDVAITDMKQVMKYSKSSTYINNKLKGVYNPRLSGA